LSDWLERIAANPLAFMLVGAVLSTLIGLLGALAF
jgi:hypothetical protein